MWYLARIEPWAWDEAMPLGTFLGWPTALGYKKHTGHKYLIMVKLTKVSQMNCAYLGPSPGLGKLHGCS